MRSRSPRRRSSVPDDPEAPSADELDTFRNLYPMDDRAWDYLMSSTGNIQAKVLKDFQPPKQGTRNDKDYSALIVSFVANIFKRCARDTPAPIGSLHEGEGGGGPREDNRRNGEEPSQAELDAFRRKFPMDDRAWDFFLGSDTPVQLKVIQDFSPKPLRNEYEDYSAAVTGFVASVAKRFRQNPSGFRKGLEEDLGFAGQQGNRAGDHGRAASPQARGDREIETSQAALVAAISDVPRATLQNMYAVCCHLPESDCESIKRCMKEVGEATGTEVHLEPAPHEGDRKCPMMRLTVQGFIPDVYTAHLQLMWAFSDRGEKPEQSAEIKGMQDQIAYLQQQLEEAKRGGGHRSGDRREWRDHGGGGGKGGKRYGSW